MTLYLNPVKILNFESAYCVGLKKSHSTSYLTCYRMLMFTETLRGWFELLT